MQTRKIKWAAVSIAFTLCVYFIMTFLKVHSSKPSNIKRVIYGKNYNHIRTERHIPIIEKYWIIRIEDSTEIRWGDHALYNKVDEPQHIWKHLYFKDSILIAEEDAFNYKIKDSVNDRLTITLDFQNLENSNCKFHRHYFGSYPLSKSKEVPFDFADSILNEWGFKNLYPFLKSNN